ncbi:MAG: hypothetical protein MJ014_02890 [Methanocorpusculum sp.]|nr:hypothetical protein [Methanocorpusculum sp.]
MVRSATSAFPVDFCGYDFVDGGAAEYDIVPDFGDDAVLAKDFDTGFANRG